MQHVQEVRTQFSGVEGTPAEQKPTLRCPFYLTKNSCVQLYLSWNVISQHQKTIINIHEEDRTLWHVYKPRFIWILWKYGQTPLCLSFCASSLEPAFAGLSTLPLLDCLSFLMLHCEVLYSHGKMLSQSFSDQYPFQIWFRLLIN